VRACYAICTVILLSRVLEDTILYLDLNVKFQEFFRVNQGLFINEQSVSLVTQGGNILIKYKSEYMFVPISEGKHVIFVDWTSWSREQLFVIFCFILNFRIVWEWTWVSKWTSKSINDNIIGSNTRNLLWNCIFNLLENLNILYKRYYSEDNVFVPSRPRSFEHVVSIPSPLRS